MSRSRACAASALLLGAAFAGVAFGARGGTELGRTTVVELCLVAVGGVATAAGVLWARRGPLHGGWALAALGVLAALTAISIGWSVSPELTFEDAGRMLAYLAVFAGAVAAARLVPRQSAVVLHGVLLGAMAVLAYALASRVWPSSLAADEISNRLAQPFDYWNAVGTTAAMVVPASLWLASRRAGSALPRALAYPAMGVAILAMLLTQSRGALAAAVIGAAIWFALVPLRLRSLPVLLIGAAGAAPVAAWALSKDAFAKYAQPLAAKESIAGEFGLLVLLMVAALLVAGLLTAAGQVRVAAPMVMRRRIGIAAVVAVAAIPLVLFTSVAFSDRGLGGTISDRVDDLTNENATVTENAGRLTASSNSRSRYWREAGRIYTHNKLVGTGANTFSTARLRFRKGQQVSRHAHGFVMQTLADLGLLGLGVSLALLAAWLAASGRATGLLPRIRRRGSPLRRRDWTPERAALVALGLVALVFGVQSAIDWTWFTPGPAVMALASAGFVAGRGPLAPVGAPAPPAATQEGPTWRALGISAPVPERAAVVAAVVVGLAALLFAWTIWTPEASDRASNRALALVEQGDLPAAERDTHDAEDIDPLSPKPLLVRAAVQTAAGREPAARRTLERAVLRFPSDPQTWLRLASFQLGTLDRPRAALESVEALLFLDPHSRAGHRLFLDARARDRVKRADRARKAARER